jgi:hypothetical protein
MCTETCQTILGVCSFAAPRINSDRGYINGLCFYTGKAVGKRREYAEEKVRSRRARDFWLAWRSRA